MMYRTHPVLKSFCVILISLALLSITTIKKKGNSLNNKTTKVCDNDSILIDEGYEFGSVLNNDNTSVFARKLYILGLFESTTKWNQSYKSEYEILAAKLAVKHINVLDMLNGVKLELFVNDTKCDPGVGMDRLFHAIYSKYPIFMLLGLGCSNVTERLAQIVSYWNIIQVSYGSSSPLLSDRNKFPLFFRTVTSDSSHNIAKVQFVKQFKWKVVATFTQNENKFLLPVNRLIADLEKDGIVCQASVTFSLDNFKEQLELLKNLNVRIIFGSFSLEMTSRIICAVQEMGMLDKYVWLLHNRNNFKLDEFINCSLKSDITGIITISDYNENFNDCMSLEMRNEDFLNDLKLLNKNKSPYSRYTYDAIWSVVYALKNFNKDDLFHIIENFYQSKEKLVTYMNQLTFTGLSGPIRFNEGNRVGNSVFRQYQSGKLETIAIFNSIKYTLNFNCSTCKNIIWKNNEVPLARRILKVSRITIPNLLFITIIVCSSLGILASMSFLYFNIKYKQRKFVKLSSPNLSNITVLGCTLVYLSVIVLGLHNSSIDLNSYFNMFCSVRVYLLSTGFSLTFGSIMAKTYRIHRLFTYLRSGFVKDKLLQDQQLIFLIFIPLAVDAFIIALWLMIDPLQKKVYNLNLEISFGEKGVDYQPQVEMCYSHNITGWYIALLGYKILFILMGTYMAWKTRYIKIEVLNDSQYIGICIYTTVFTSLIVLTSNLISNHILVTYIIQSLTILTATTIILFLMFLPTVKSVFGKLDSTDPIMQSMGLMYVSNTRRMISNDSRENLHRLEIQNRIYRCHLIKLDNEIAYLTRVLEQREEKY